MASIIRIANLEKTYDITNTKKQVVLKGVNAEFNTGELVALLGESGCGKSTLINILGGLDTNYTGSVIIKGKFIRDYSEKEMDDYRKKRVGLIFQHYYLIPHMNLKENVEIAMEMSEVDSEVRKTRAMDLLKMVGLDKHANKLPNQLSGGQKQRVAIARSLANNPSILLADEPTGALDNESSAIILNILKKIAKSGKLVILVTHSNKVANECNRIVKIEDGVIVDDQTKEVYDTKEYEKYTENKPKDIKTKNIFKLSKRNLFSNLTRNLLVSFGMSIGICAVILILCLSQGLTNYVKDYYGEDVKNLSISAIYAGEVDDDLNNYVKDIDGVSSVVGVHSASKAKLKYNEYQHDIYQLTSYVANFEPILLYGQLLNNHDEIIINEAFANYITGGALIACVGYPIEITYLGVTNTFIIKGIYQDISSNPDGFNCYVSENGINTFFDEQSTNNLLYIAVKDITYLDSVTSQLDELGFLATTYDDSSSIVLEYIDLGTTVLTSVSAISMVVSVIMIVIVLYISVIERTQEIGILRAIGARRSDVLKVFIFEAGLLGFLAGIFGCILSLVIASVANLFCYASLEKIFISYNPIYYILGIALTIGFSLLAGIAPSLKAANLDPIDAIRSE